MDRLASKGGFSQGTGFALALVLVALAGVFFPLHLGENKWLGFLAPISTFVIFLFIGRGITSSGLLRVCNKPKVTMLVQGFIFGVPWAIAFVLTFIAPSSFFSNLIAPILFPLLSTLWIFGVGYGGIPFSKVAAEVYPRLALLILLPAILGWYSRKIPLLGETPRTWESKVPQACILFLSYLAFASGSALSLVDLPMIEWVGLAGWTMGCWLILSFLGWVCGKIGDLDIPERKSTYFVVSQKSLATGIPLIFATMGTKSMEGLIWLVLPLTLYHMFQLITGAGVIAWLHARK
jgi:predicted Na+-dependent transporter